MVPDAHTFQDLTVLQEDSADTLVTSIDLMLAFPFVVQVSKVRDLRITSSTKINIKAEKGDREVTQNYIAQHGTTTTNSR